MTLSAPKRYDGGGSGMTAVGVRFAKSTVLAEQVGNGHATSWVGPTAEIA